MAKIIEKNSKQGEEIGQFSSFSQCEKGKKKVCVVCVCVVDIHTFSAEGYEMNFENTKFNRQIKYPRTSLKV